VKLGIRIHGYGVVMLLCIVDSGKIDLGLNLGLRLGLVLR
jgi:hypothetical protein